MATRRTAPPAVLDARMVDLLLEGPWRVHLDLLTAPDHDRLRMLWRAHEPVLRAEAKRRRLEQIWFLARDAFVTMLETGQWPDDDDE